MTSEEFGVTEEFGSTDTDEYQILLYSQWKVPMISDISQWPDASEHCISEWPDASEQSISEWPGLHSDWLVIKLLSFDWSHASCHSETDYSDASEQ